MDIFQVHSAIFIFSKTEWSLNFDQGTWKFAMTKIYVLPHPCATYVTSSARSGCSDGVTETMGPRDDFCFPLPIPALSSCQHYLSSSRRVISLHPLPHLPIHLSPQSGNLSLLSISLSLSKTNLSTTCTITYFWFRCLYLSPSHLKHDHPACLRSERAQTCDSGQRPYRYTGPCHH